MSFLLPKGVFSVTAVSLLCPDPLQYVTPVRGSPLSLPVHTDRSIRPDLAFLGYTILTMADSDVLLDKSRLIVICGTFLLMAHFKVFSFFSLG